MFDDIASILLFSPIRAYVPMHTLKILSTYECSWGFGPRIEVEIVSAFTSWHLDPVKV